MNVFDELDKIFRRGYNSENLTAIKPKLENYLHVCSEEERERCQKEINLVNRLIDECREVDKLRKQYKLFYEYVQNHPKDGKIELEYIEPNGNAYGVKIKKGSCDETLSYQPMDEPEENFIHISTGQKIPVKFNNWGEIMIKTVKDMVSEQK